MKRSALRSLMKLAVGLFGALYGIAACPAQDAGKNPGDYAYGLAQHLHDAQGNYCAKPLTIKEARFLVQYYAIHKNDPLGEMAVLLSNAELEAAKSMAKGKCEEPEAAPADSAASNRTRTRAVAESSQSSIQGAAPAAPASQTKSGKDHVIRIGVASPDAPIGQPAGMPSVGEPIRTMLIQYLSGPGLEITPITTMLPIQIEAEAKEKGYDFVVYSSLTQKKGRGMGFLKAATMASSLTPIGAMAGATRAATAAAGTAAAAQAASVSSMVKAKTEYTLTYKLAAPGNSNPVLANSVSAKAKTDGEDVMTPLIQQAATAIVGQVTTRK